MYFKTIIILYIQMPNDHTRIGQFARYILHDEWIIINLLKNIISMLENGNIRMWMWYESDAPFFVHEHQPNICIIHHHQSQRWIRIIANVIQEYALINLSFIGSFLWTDGCGLPIKIGRLNSYIHKYCIIYKVISKSIRNYD